MVVYEGMWLRLVECASVYHCSDYEVKDRVDLVLNQGFGYEMNLRCKVLNLNTTHRFREEECGQQGS